MDVKGKIAQKLSRAALGNDSLNRQALKWHKSFNEAAKALGPGGEGGGGRKKDAAKE